MQRQTYLFFHKFPREVEVLFLDTSIYNQDGYWICGNEIRMDPPPQSLRKEVMRLNLKENMIKIGIGL